MLSRDEFRGGLIAFGERVQKVKAFLKNEEATKLTLIQPFIALLGYDPVDPTEVSVEHSADFSEKYKNKVDYAILKDGLPVIAIECKSVGNGKKDDRGQLKSYFNAAKSVKLGILTDGVIYELFVDSNEPNMMDDDPYLTVDFDKIVKGEIADTEIEGLYALSKTRFDPELVGDSARRSITYRLVFNYIMNQFIDPNAEFTRFLLKEVGIKHVRATSIDSFREISKAAFKDVFNASVLRKLDISSSVPTAPQKLVSGEAPAVASVPVEPQSEKGIVTTAAELAAFESVKLRLAYLVSGDAELFKKLIKVQYRDYQGKMLVYYGMERKGRLLDILEGRDGSIKFLIVDGAESTPVSDFTVHDDRLKAIYVKRVAELG